MSEKVLLLWLEGPLQSWGADSLFGRRDTKRFPTKSGIIGLILAAMGASGPQKELLKQMSLQQHRVYSFIREGQSRAMLRDFHMVGSGYDSKDSWERMFIPKTAEGKNAVGGGAKMTFRFYLQNAFFGVMVIGEETLLTKASRALERPVYNLYLGRKNCVPTDYIYRGMYGDTNDSLERLMEISTEKGLIHHMTVMEGEHEGDVFSINDIPVSFGDRKEYRDRLVTVIEE